MDAAFLAALGPAHNVRISSYVLDAGSRVTGALAAACDAGARVDVALDGAQYGSGSGIARANVAAAAELERHGAHVRLTTPREPAMHMKAAVVDGIAYLDDRNWVGSGQDTILAVDDPSEVAAIGAALATGQVATGPVATSKAAALALELQTLRTAPAEHIDLETESFGATALSKELAARATHGAHVRLLVSQAELRGPSGLREERALAKLARAGVAIALSGNTEKLCVAGAAAWIGSANATFSPGAMTDWGFRTRDPAIVAGLASAFEANWKGARALAFPASNDRVAVSASSQDARASSG